MSRWRRTLSDTWARTAVLPLLLFLAERDLRMGRLLSARRRFLAAAQRRPTSFRAHFGLARVYLATNDIGLARRELAVARSLGPARYRELRHRLPEPYRHEDHVVAPGALGSALPVRDVQAARSPDEDFRDSAERERLARLGPIRDDEVQGVDWDAVLAQIAACDDGRD